MGTKKITVSVDITHLVTEIRATIDGDLMEELSKHGKKKPSNSTIVNLKQEIKDNPTDGDN